MKRVLGLIVHYEGEKLQGATVSDALNEAIHQMALDNDVDDNDGSAELNWIWGKPKDEVKAAATNEITAYVHCQQCLEELPRNTSPHEWGQLEVGFSAAGLQVWCKRHEFNVMHINFEGQKHPANTTRMRISAANAN